MEVKVGLENKSVERVNLILPTMIICLLKNFQGIKYWIGLYVVSKLAIIILIFCYRGTGMLP